MRIIAGLFKGHRLLFSKKNDFRPTQDRVKESIFNIIQSDIEGARFLDGCAGTGSIGFEALSRGASHVVMVDPSLTFVNKNLQLLNEKIDKHENSVGRVKTRRQSLISYLKKCDERFDIIFLDPPWNMTHIYEDSLQLIFDFDILSPNGIIICEHHKRDDMPSLDSGKDWALYTYGTTRLSVLKV